MSATRHPSARTAHWAGLLTLVACLGAGVPATLWAAAPETRLYATNNIRVLNVNPDTGDRILLSGSGQGSGPNFVSPAGVAILNAGTPLFVAEPGAQRILSVDTRDGARTILSDNAGAGSGPDFYDPLDITLFKGDSLVVVEPGSAPAGAAPRLLEVSVVTGDRAVVSGDGLGAGPAFAEPRGVAVESSGTLLVADRGNDALFRVDPLTGDRAIISSNSVGAGPAYQGLRGVAIDDIGDGDPSNDLIYLLDSGESPGSFAVFRVNGANGNRTVVSSGSVGSGPQMSENVTDIEVRDTGTIAVTDPTASGGSGQAVVIAINPGTGNRSIMAGAGVGAGPPLGDNIAVWGPRYITFGVEPDPLPAPNNVPHWARYD